MTDQSKLHRLLRQAELHSQTLKAQLQIIELRTQMMQMELDSYKTHVNEAKRFAICHQAMLEQATAAALELVSESE